MPDKRVLDLVGEHGRHAGDGARRGAVRELALDHLRHGALLQHDDDEMRLVGHRPAVDVDELGRGELRARHVDAVLVDGRAGGAHLVDEGEQRAAEGDDVVEREALQDGDAGREERLGRGVGVDDAVLVGEDEDRMRQRGRAACRARRARREIA